MATLQDIQAEIARRQQTQQLQQVQQAPQLQAQQPQIQQPQVQQAPQQVQQPQGLTLQDIQAEIARRQQTQQLQQVQPGPGVPGVFPSPAQPGGLEAAASIASGVPAEIGGGIAGLATALTPGTAPGSGAAVSEAVRESLTFDPRTEEGKKALQDIGGSDAIQAISKALKGAEEGLGDAGFDLAGPVGGAIGATLPTAILEAMGLAAPAAAARALKATSRRAKETGKAAKVELDELRAQTPEEGLKEASQALQSGDQADIAAVVQPDKKFFTAADELGISVEPLASFASQNPQFRALEQGLASIPASQLDAQSKAFIGQLSQKADNLIEQYGGTLDKAELSDRFRSESIKSIDKLSLKADDLYDTLGKKIPGKTPVEAPNTVSFILKKAQELGGRKELSAQLNRVLRQLETTEKAIKPGRVISASIGKTVPGKPGAPTTVIDLATGQMVPGKPGAPTRISGVAGSRTAGGVIDQATGKMVPGKTELKQPTHERLNQTRKEVGQALNKRSGPFKDQETGLLKALYGRLRKDQDAVADIEGVGDVSEAANSLVIQRKQVEDNLAKLLGKDLEGSILPRVGRELKQLSKGEIQKWDSTMKRIPDSMRQEIVVTALNDIFKGTNVGGQSLNPTQFTKFMNDLDKSPAVKKRLFKELPEESIKALENLRTVSKGVSTALQDRIPTGRIAALFDDNDGFLRRMMGKAISLAVTAKTGPLGGSVVNEFINQASSGARTASAVLASPQFQNMIRIAVKEGVQDGARVSQKVKKVEKAFEKSAKFQRWSESLSNSDKTKLATVGTISYLLQDHPQQ